MAAITLRKARTIMRAALKYRQEASFRPLAVLVLDPGGHPMAFEREDGASPGRYAIAHGKAYGALMLGAGSRALMNRAESQAYFIGAAGAVFNGALVPVPGGVLMRNGRGALVGAVGVSGDSSDNDEAAAIAGIEAAKLVAETG